MNRTGKVLRIGDKVAEFKGSSRLKAVGKDAKGIFIGYLDDILDGLEEIVGTEQEFFVPSGEDKPTAEM